MTGIFYFSSTGNSLYIAQEIRKRINADIMYIPHSKDRALLYDRIIIVSPVYSFGLPIHTYNFLITLNPSAEIYLILNYGGMLGGADRFAYELAKEHNITLHAVFTLKMPENYTLFITPPKFYLKRSLKAAPQKINDIVEAIQQKKTFIPKPRKTKKNIYEKNRKNWHLIAADFSVNNNCILCAKCVRLCPVGNIELNDKIRFKDHCVACLGCYHRCPQKAIIYKHRKKKHRYVNPFISEYDIGEDL